VDPVGSILAEPPELNEGGVGMYQVTCMYVKSTQERAARVRGCNSNRIP